MNASEKVKDLDEEQDDNTINIIPDVEDDLLPDYANQEVIK